MKTVYCTIVVCLFLTSTVAMAGWTDDFSGYITNASFWDGTSPGLEDVPWFNISSPTKYGRVFNYDAATGNWGIEGNQTNKLFGLTYNKVWYNRAIGSYSATDTIEYSAQVAAYRHPNSGITYLHPSWPLGDHIVIGGVALGIGGDDITYQVLGGVPNPLTTEISNTTVTRVAPIDGLNHWYDVKIVLHQVEGLNNDLADLFYKRSTDADWTTIVTSLATNSDAGTNAYLYLSGADWLGAVDNVALVVPEPATIMLLTFGAMALRRKK